MNYNCPTCDGLMNYKKSDGKVFLHCDVCGLRFAKDDNINDNINHPSHYTSRGKIECIEVAEMFNLNRGSAIQYIWRAGEKSKETEIEDLKKAVWYLQREIARLQNG